jgi:hypothetical protein
VEGGELIVLGDTGMVAAGQANVLASQLINADVLCRQLIATDLSRYCC